MLVMLALLKVAGWTFKFWLLYYVFGKSKKGAVEDSKDEK